MVEKDEIDIGTIKAKIGNKQDIHAFLTLSGDAYQPDSKHVEVYYLKE